MSTSDSEPASSSSASEVPVMLTKNVSFGSLKNKTSVERHISAGM